MATGKRYYWIKLRESFMTSDTVDFLMSQKDGANYVVLYQMLCLKTINTDGKLSRQIGEIVIPYDVNKIQRDCKWFSVDTIRIALDLYKKFGLIYEEMDGTLVLADHDNMVGTETDWSEKKRRQRSALPSGDNVPLPVPKDVPTDIRDKSIDIRDKSIDTDITTINEKDDSSNKEYVGREQCAETPGNGRSTPSNKPKPTPSGFEIPLNDGSLYNVPMENITVYRMLYPAVDVEQELRNMIGWCMSHPNRRKTNTGVKAFITKWLKREQDKSKGQGQRQGQKRQPPMEYHEPDYENDW